MTNTEVNTTVTDFNKTMKKDLLLIDPRIIVEQSDFNTRLEMGNIDELMNSIISEGVKRPLVGFKQGDTYVLTDGHRRFTAIQKALELGHEIARVPFISEKPKSLEERTLDIILSNDGKPLTPMELSNTYQRLINAGFTVAEIARRTGKTYNHVNETLLLQQASRKTQQMIVDKKVSASTVKEMLKKSDSETVQKTLETTEVTKDGKVDRKQVVAKMYTEKAVQTMLMKQLEAVARKFDDETIKKIIMETSLVIDNK